MVIGAYGVLEPEEKKLTTGNIDFVVVPGLAFDKKGVRIGYGLGYYDKFLSSTGAMKVALAFDFQLAEKLPKEQHDVLMDIIVTEKQVIRNGK